MAQCQAITKDGKPCEISVPEGEKFCHIHLKDKSWQRFLSKRFWQRTLNTSLVVFAISLLASITGLLEYFDIKPNLQPATATLSSNLTPTLTPIPLISTSTKEPELIFGPQQGYLEEDKGFLFRPDYPNLKVHNSIISVTFFNPDSTDAWSYNIYFRDKVGVESNRFSICSCGTWSLYSSPSTKGLTKLYSGTISNLNTSGKGQNTIVLTIKDLSISIIVNEKPVSNEKMELDVDLGSGGVAIVSNTKIGYGGLRIISLNETLPKSNLPTSPETTTLPPSLRYQETFDNSNNWDVGNDDHTEYFVEKTVKDGKYFRTMSTKDNSNGTWASTAIVSTPQNFCLLFDAQILDTSQDTSVIVNLRTNDFGTGFGSYYIIHLFSDGSGEIELDKSGSEGIVKLYTFSDGFSWNDKQIHTVKISFQESELNIFDGQTGKQIKSASFTGDNLLVSNGEIRLGLEVRQPNQKSTLVLDNIYVYDNKCP